MPPLYDRYRRGQPGELSRPQAWWDVYARDPEWTRQGASRHYDVVYESAPGRVDGWVSYRVENRWPNGLAANIIKVRMLVGLTPEAEAALWRYLLDLDLAGTVKLADRPVDDPIRWRLADPRRLRVTDVGDHLWLRLLDLPGALAARRYAVAGRAGARGHRRPAPPQPGPLPPRGRPRRRHLRADHGQPRPRPRRRRPRRRLPRRRQPGHPGPSRTGRPSSPPAPSCGPTACSPPRRLLSAPRTSRPGSVPSGG